MILAVLTTARAVPAPPAGDRAKAEAKFKETVDGLVRDGNLTAAVAGFAKAHDLDPTYPAPLEYLGEIAFNRSDWAMAIKHFEAYLALDSTSDQYTVVADKLNQARQYIKPDSMQGGKEFRTHFHAAEQAFNDGLMVKAAREYTAAYQALPTRADIGIRAAGLWIERKEYLQAVHVLNLMRSMPMDAATIAQVNQMCAPLGKELDELFRSESAAGWGLLDQAKVSGADLATAAGHFQAALELRPQVHRGSGSELDAEGSPYIGLALAHAAGGNVPYCVKALTRGTKAGLLIEAPDVFSSPLWDKVRKDAKLAEFVADAFGPKLAAALVKPPPASLRTITNSIGMKLVRIQAGDFMMGSRVSEAERDADETQHKVTLTKSFYLQTTPVTQAQWQAVVGNNPSHFKGDDRPVESVCWDEVVEFCQKLSAKENKKYRLPTEAEWEYACRAGTATPFGGTGNLDEMGWYSGKSGEQTHPVGQKKANAWGLYDMHGNVLQWCSDYYGPYGGDATDPGGAAHGHGYSSRVLRGGSWDDVPRNCRGANRFTNAPTYRNNSIGFRVCLNCP